jgi:hypothetical protein
VSNSAQSSAVPAQQPGGLARAGWAENGRAAINCLLAAAPVHLQWCVVVKFLIQMPPLSPFRCTSAPATQAFVAAAGSADKTLHLVPGGFHEVLMSPGVGEGLADGMIAWIKQHSGAAGGSAKM